jgi:E3 ubiquitin-protein ligase UBR4
MDEIQSVGGVRAIPFLQLVLSLAFELDGDSDRDKATLDSLLSSLLTRHMKYTDSEMSLMISQDPRNEVELVILRMLSVLMSRTRTTTTGKTSQESLSFVNIQTGLALVASKGIDYCLHLLIALLPQWQKELQEPDTFRIGPQLLKPRTSGLAPDMSPFFLRQYVKSHSNNIFEEYHLLLMEIVLRLPYQIKKILETCPNVHLPPFDEAWFKVLTEYMMTSPHQVSFVRRHVRKLLLYICGSKESYRQLRDVRFLDTHMTTVRAICEKRGISVDEQNQTNIISLNYDTLLSLIDHMKSCLEIATSRTVNWQKYCCKEEVTLPFLLYTSVSIDDGVAPLILQLLQCAIGGTKMSAEGASTASATSPSPGKAKTPTAKEKKEEKSEMRSLSETSAKKKELVDDISRTDPTLSHTLVQTILRTSSRSLLVRFITSFLLESNQASVRWQAHSLILQIYK